ncbi:hypothetical protein OUZ56_007674 [Daphnia magna]|uniref:Uncharacterized protein n=1 Tax=Daphnia magna TaxID=35525 RepID=A0ABR0AAZ6_9CRUS|nr:hypothetical protein OUZ56_007674 [Daphnia magna]
MKVKRRNLRRDDFIIPKRKQMDGGDPRRSGSKAPSPLTPSATGRRSRTTKRQAEEEDEKLTKARKEKIHGNLADNVAKEAGSRIVRARQMAMAYKSCHHSRTVSTSRLDVYAFGRHVSGDEGTRIDIAAEEIWMPRMGVRLSGPV